MRKFKDKEGDINRDFIENVYRWFTTYDEVKKRCSYADIGKSKNKVKKEEKSIVAVYVPAFDQVEGGTIVKVEDEHSVKQDGI